MSQKERPDGTEQVTNRFGKKWIRCCSREDMTRVRAGTHEFEFGQIAE